MFKRFFKYSILAFFLVFAFQSQLVLAASFNEKLSDIRSEINRDNLNEAIKKLKKIKIESELQQDQINLLFGDIYLKINKPQKAEEFYEKSFMTTNERIESLTFIGLAEVKLRQGQIDKAIDFAEKSIAINSDFIRPKIILADAKTRIGETDEALDILKDLYLNNKNNAEVNLAIAGYYSSFDDANSAIEILEKYLKSEPTSIKVMNKLGSLYWQIGNKDKALELKSKVLKHHEFNKNKYQAKKIKNWILSIDPNYFKKKHTKGIKPKQSKEYEKKEIDNYEENQIVHHYEEFDFVEDSGGSGFIVGNGKFVVTNFHVIEGAKKIAVRNGIGKVSNAQIYEISEKYDLALLILEKPFLKKHSISSKNFQDPKHGEDVICIGYPLVGGGLKLPMITQGIVSKIMEERGIFLTTAAVNSGNSGGPIFNLNGKLIGISFASLNKEAWLKDFNISITDLGLGISSSKIIKVFEHKRTVPISKVKYEKTKVYEMMLPSVVVVSTLKNLEKK
jgi:tetratricopeptide (TPR) repeat protein